MSAAPEIRYAQNGDVHIAYQTIGNGPLDIVFVDGFITHLRAQWDDPAYRRFAERLATFARVILFDKRGMGLSDRVAAGTLEERADDVRAVMDAVGSERASLIGVSEGGPMSILLAATHPERTHSLMLCGAEVKEEISDDWPWGESTPEEHEAYVQAVPERWGTIEMGRSIVSGVMPSAAGDEAAAEAWRRIVVEGASPGAAIAFVNMAFAIDVRDIVPSVDVPTLIVHTTGDAVCRVENARWLADHLPGARYVELDGRDHVPWGENADEILAEIQEFLTGVREPQAPERVLATILFTDIVGSTERAHELGDRRWAELLERHHASIRRELDRYRGREIDTAGDGFFAAFDGPARAIRCARAAVESIRGIGLDIRAGLHTGECEVMGDSLGGIAVHIGARVAGQAGAGEVLVSSTVRDLVAGSGVEFEDRGLALLKGVPGEWRLYAVAG